MYSLYIGCLLRGVLSGFGGSVPIFCRVSSLIFNIPPLPPMAQLPPKIPTMTPHWPDLAFAGGHQKLPAPPFMAPANPAAATTHGGDNGSNNPSWVDEFLDFSQARRGAHRRSASDSIAFLDSGMLLEDACRLDAGASNNNNNVASAGPSSNAGSGSGFERFDDEQFMSMFTDEISPRPVSSSNNNGPAAGVPGVLSPNPSAASDHNSSINEEKQRSPQMHDHHRTDQKTSTVTMKDEADEVRGHCEPAETAARAGNAVGSPGTATASVTGSSERIVDPKRVKR